MQREPFLEPLSTRGGHRPGHWRASQARLVLCRRPRPGYAPTRLQQERGPMSEPVRFEARSTLAGAAERCVRAAIAYEGSCLAVPFRINPVDRILQHGCRTVVLFWGHENKPIRGSYFGGPTFYNLILVGRAAGHGRRHGLVKEGHRKVAKVERPPT